MKPVIEQVAAEHRQRAFELRASGLSYREIGKVFGVSGSRARQLVVERSRGFRDSNPLSQLPQRVQRCLLRGWLKSGQSTSPITTIEQLVGRQPKELLALSNFSKGSLRACVDLLAEYDYSTETSLLLRLTGGREKIP